jgi:hypothetical protein
VIAAALALAFTAACVASLTYLHLAPTGYSPVRNAVSEYGVGRYARWDGIQASCTGLAALCLAVALGHPRRVAARGARGRADPDRLGPDRHAHVDPANAARPGSFAARVRRVATMLALRPSLRPWFGLVERGYYVALLTWLAVVSAGLL